MTTSHLPSARVGSKPRALPGEALELVREVALEPPDHCYPWPFGKDRLGYGRVFYQGKTRPAHRVAWELHHGIVMGVEFDACHQPMICHDRSCINPLHIRPGTRAENMADCDIDGTRPYGTKSGRAKLTDAQVILIHADERSYSKIAQAFGVSYDTVRSIKTGRRWRWLFTKEARNG